MLAASLLSLAASLLALSCLAWLRKVARRLETLDARLRNLASPLPARTRPLRDAEAFRVAETSVFGGYDQMPIVPPPLPPGRLGPQDDFGPPPIPPPPPPPKRC